ncbi:MAG: protein translocase subunit SecD [Verrucomicrobiota bacterium]|nr:protein translocase subunit SecD [Verrucomicrobiota bacterium]
MSPILTFCAGLLLLILFGWYFATDYGLRKRVLATVLGVLLVLFSLATIWPPKEKIRLGLDIQGGTSFLIRLVGADKEVTKAMLDQAVEVIRKRVDYFGGGEPIISPVGNDRILVQIPGLDTAKIQEAREQLSRVAKLEFSLVHPQNSQLIAQIDAGQGIIPPDYRLVTYSFDPGNGKPKQEEKLLVHRRPDLTGDHITHAFAGYQNDWQVNLELDSEGAKKFDQLAADHFHERFAILLDGGVQSAPSINAKYFGGRAMISGGRMGEKEARNLSSVLENPLQTPVSIEEERSVSPTLGLDSIRSSIIAGLVGLAITLLCVVIYYRFVGLVANLALLVNIVLLIGVLTMFNFVLTLPGIAGIILTVGIAVDASVLIYERLREELALGKTLKIALQSAYEKAFSSIFDANVTTLITAAILFWMASGPVKGFAISLTLGILASLFTALIVGRSILSWFIDTGKVKKVTMLHLISSQHVNFLGKGPIAVACSLALIIAGASAFVIRGDRNFGVDFKGGDLISMSSTQPVSVHDVREAIKTVQLPNGQSVNMEDASIQQSQQAGKNYITIRGPLNTSEAIERDVMQKLPQAGFKVEQAERVGALVGGELAKSSLWALAIGILGILIYVTFRFELSFAIGAIVALLHDVIITVGIFSLLGRELTLTMVGAVLTIAGYSINDTIVVYDRIREGLASGRKGSVEQIMNDSINQTLSRTLLTSGVTLIPILCLFLFGGSVLRDFALAIIIGVVVGTYSSIFIASPIVLWWTNMRGGGGAGLRREVIEKTTPATPAAAVRS